LFLRELQMSSGLANPATDVNGTSIAFFLQWAADHLLTNGIVALL
jgi:hypothetical protein